MKPPNAGSLTNSGRMSRSIRRSPCVRWLRGTRWTPTCSRLGLPFEIGDLGQRADLLEELAAPRRARQTRQLAFLGSRLNLRGADALHAERALLHHADFTHRHVRVELQVKRLVPGRIEKVEEPDVVRARVRAVPRADAAVVHLSVQPFVGVMAGVGRTDRLAR